MSDNVSFHNFATEICQFFVEIPALKMDEQMDLGPLSLTSSMKVFHNQQHATAWQKYFQRIRCCSFYFIMTKFNMIYLSY